MSGEDSVSETTLHYPFPCQLTSWAVTVGSKVCKGSLLCSCVQSVGGTGEGDNKVTNLQIKSSVVGFVQQLMFNPGDIIQPGSVMVKVEKKCQHDIVVFDMCADCGLNLRNKPTTTSGSAPQSVAANIMAIHDNAGIRISQQEAEVLAYKDKLRLLKTRKLTLVVDLDQTLIHTSTDPHIEPGLPDVYGFHLAGQPILYHCRLRPHARQFLEKVSKMYELHVFTMATKDYAAAVINILDPEKHLFCDRIITRDEFFDPRSKALRFKAVFPCGDSMVAIIDDREDVWGRCPNLVHVKPYVFFSGTSDINAPPPLVPTSASPSPASCLPSTPTTPRPFFGGTSTSYGVVPQGQPRPFKMRHISRQPRQFPRSVSQPISNLTAHSQSAKGNGTQPTHQQLSSVDNSSAGSIGDDVITRDHTQSELTSNRHDEITECGRKDNLINNQEDHNKQFMSDDVNSNSNNNNSNSKESGESGGSGSDGEEEDTADHNGEGKEVEGEHGIVKGEGGDKGGMVKGKGGNGSSSSSTGSSSDSDDSSSSGSSSGMDESQSQQQQIPLKETLCDEPVVGNDGGNIETLGSDGADAGRIDDEENDKIKSDKKHESMAKQEEMKQTESTIKDKKKEKPAVEITDNDSFLIYLGDVLERIHSIFYTRFTELIGGQDISTMSDIPTPDLKLIIPEMRQSLLKGAKILFTGVIPTNTPPQRSPIWNTARAFGAVVHDKLVPGLSSSRPQTVMKATTHVIAGKSGTAKLKEARRVPGVKIVNPRWLWSCAEQWRWVDERDFPVESEDSAGNKEMKKKEKDKDKRDNEENMQQNTAQLLTEPDTKTKSSDLTKKPQLPSDNTTAVSVSIAGRSTSRLESRISVSDEELERMEAEVEAEMMGSSSSGSSGEEGEGERGSIFEDTFNHEPLASRSDHSILQNRKRKHVEIDDSSCSNSPQSTSEPHANSDSSDDDDVLAALLAGDSSSP